MPLIIPSNSISALGYEVDNSLRLDDASNTYMTRTPASAGNRKTFTFSLWVKRCDTTESWFLAADSGGGTRNGIRFNGDNFDVVFYESAAYQNVTTTQVFRDVSAWYHLVAAIDTTQATSSDRIKLYVNGSQITNLSSTDYPSQNFDFGINNNVLHYLFADQGGGSELQGYASEVVFIDGQQLDPTSFGEFDEDSGIWKPIDVSGLTFGTNGFYLDFENSGSLGADVSGNGNNFTVNNLTSIDQTTDTPTNNFATMNPLYVPSANPPTFSEGNTKAVSGSTSYFGGASTFGVSSGKWYWEVKCNSNNTTPRVDVGNVDDYAPLAFNSNNGAYLCYGANGYGYVANGNKCNNNSETAYGSTWTTNDIISVAMDLDNHKIYFAKNGVWQNSGDPTSGVTGTGAAFSMTTGLTYIAGCGDGSSSASDTFSFNFGNPPFTISSGNSDANSRGNFEYPVPSGYFSLCTANLSEYG